MTIRPEASHDIRCNEEFLQVKYARVHSSFQFLALCAEQNEAQLSGESVRILKWAQRRKRCKECKQYKR